MLERVDGRLRALGVFVGVTTLVGLGLSAWSVGPAWLPAGAVGALALMLTWPGARTRSLVYDLPARAPQRSLTAEEREVLEREVSFYRRLSTERRALFEARVERFLAEHPMEAAKGAVLDTETRVLIAASAATLLLGRPLWDFPPTRIVVTPRAFGDRRRRVTGTAWGGPDPAVRIAQDALKDAFRNSTDGHHIGLHELAHLLDADGSGADGIPSMMAWDQVPGWLELLRNEAARLGRGDSVLDRYGRTNSAELFAVAVEAFFEKPAVLREKHPELYAALAAFFQQDLAAEAGY
jgi:MtfA peptidase